MSGEVSERSATFHYENGGFSGDKRESHANQERSNGHSHVTNEGDAKSQPNDGNKTTTTNNNNTNAEEEEVDDTPDLSCGLGPLRTRIFGSCFANLYVFAILFGFSNFFTHMSRQVVQVHITSLERQFNIDNAHAGLFESVERIGFTSTVLFVAHFAKKAHIPVIIGVFGTLQGLMMMAPAFLQLANPYELQVLPPQKHHNASSNTTDIGDLGENAPYMCFANAFVGNDTNSTGQPLTNSTGAVDRAAFIVILLAQATKGVTDTFHSGFLPMIYMDDNLVDKSRLGIFMGIWNVLSELSNPLGKQINGVLTEVPIDLKETNMDPADRRFVAAWWLAYLTFGAGTVLTSFPVMFFPRRLISKKKRADALDRAKVTFAGGQIQDETGEEPGEENNQADDETNPAATESRAELSDSKKRRYSRNSTHMTADGRRGSRRPSFFPPVVGPTDRRVSLDGELVFQQPIKKDEEEKKKKKAKDKPKKEESFLETVKDFPMTLYRILSKPAYVLLLIDIALISVPLSGISMFRNSFQANEYNVPMSEVAWMYGVTSAIGHIGGTLVTSFLTTKMSTKLGYMGYISFSYICTLIIIPFYFMLTCDNVPVYGFDGPFGIPVNTSDTCDCTSSKQLISCGDDGNNYLSPCYAGCTDVDGKLFTECSLLTNTSAGTTVTPGLCPTDCHTHFVIYAILHGSMSFFSSMAQIPRRLLVLRIVDPKDRGFATGFFHFAYNALAIPSPNLFGGVVDGTCIIWDGDYCSLYDRDKFRHLMAGLDLGVHMCVQTTYMIMLTVFLLEERRSKKAMKENGKAQDSEDDVTIHVVKEEPEPTKDETTKEGDTLNTRL